MSRQSVIIAALVSVVLIILALTVWPTVYRYDRMKLGSGTDFLVRINRFTGTTHFLDPTGWQLAKEPELVKPKKSWRDDPIVEPAKTREFTDEELLKELAKPKDDGRFTWD